MKAPFIISDAQLFEVHGGTSEHSSSFIYIEHLHHVMIVQEAINYTIGFYLNGPAEDDYIGRAVLSFFTSCKDTAVSLLSSPHNDTCIQ